MIRLYARAPATSLVIEETADGVFLYSRSNSGFVGDTWHQSVEDAKAQASFAYGLAVWKSVPEAVTDLAAFLRQIPIEN